MAWDAARALIAVVPGAQQFVASATGQSLRHWLARHFEERRPYTFTQFSRLPTQLEALTGPVLDFLGPQRRDLRVVVLGCATGAEPYTISSLLRQCRPELALEIDAYDIDHDALRIARSGVYEADKVFSNPLVTEPFTFATFDRDGQHLIVKPEIASRVSFHIGDAADPKLRADVAPADIVFAQNVMCNLRRPLAKRVFDNAVALMKPHAVLFVDGMDVDMRQSRSRRHGLVPLDYEIERIHSEARIVRGGERYPWEAASLEPFSNARRDWKRRYATIFLNLDSGR